jgi:hypothetical protein
MTVTDFNPEIAWAAGFFDGEGCVRASAASGKKKGYSARCTVANTDPRPISKFHELFGGTVSVRESKMLGQRRSFEWTIQGDELDEFISQILPFSMTKREQLELLLKFRELMPGRGFRKITNSERWKERKRLSKLAFQISELKWVEADGYN